MSKPRLFFDLCTIVHKSLLLYLVLEKHFTQKSVKDEKFLTSMSDQDGNGPNRQCDL
jgi:hypothetical protein